MPARLHRDPRPHRDRVDLGVGAVTVAVGTAWLVLALRIDAYSDDVVGPRAVPVAISIGMLALGAIVCIRALFGRTRGDEVGADGEFGFRGANLARVAAVIGSGLAFVVAFHAFGYLAATAVALLLALLAFGNRRPVLLAAVTVAGAIIYHTIFMHLMGLHDPPGAWLDLRALVGSALSRP